MPTFTFSLLTGACPGRGAETPTEDAGSAAGENPRRRIVWQDTLRQVRSWLCPWARPQLYWHRRPTAPPPPQPVALLDHVGHSHPLAAPI
ncbi:hypothetical protein [Streptomyces sp. NPDC002540]